MKFYGAGDFNNANFAGAGRQYLVETPTGVLYWVGIDTNIDVYFVKSLDRGITWSKPTIIFTGSATAVSVWYDRWSGIAAGLIHVAYQESVTDDTKYRTINTESSDSLSTETTIQTGTSTAAGGCLSVCRARGGNVYCATMIDAGAEGGFYRLPNANVPNGAWDAARATVFEAVTGDLVILMPGFAADNQDMIALFWDASADEISRKIYDDSANSWAETSISTGMSDGGHPSAIGGPHWGAAPDLAANKIFMAAWNGAASTGAPLNADLMTWTVDESTITAGGNVITNCPANEQGGAAVAVDANNGDYWCWYYGKSDGSQSYDSDIRLYGKKSTDDAANWSAEIEYFPPTNHVLYGGAPFSLARYYNSDPPLGSGRSDGSGNPHFGVVGPDERIDVLHLGA